MQNKDFNIAKFLKENRLGSYGALNHYVDLKPLREEGGAYNDAEDDTQEVPYAGGDNLTGQGEGDSFKQADTVSEATPMKLGSPNIHPTDLIDTDLDLGALKMEMDALINRMEEIIQYELTNDETISQINPKNPKQTAAQIRLLIKKLWIEQIQNWGGRVK